MTLDYGKIPKEVDSMIKERKRKKLSKEERLKIFEMFDQKCAYCGEDFNDIKDMQADHIRAFHKGGECSEDNFYPACRSCNSWKMTYSIEQFRKEIEAQHERLLSRQGGYRLAMRYGQIEHVIEPVVFWFENYK